MKLRIAWIKKQPTKYWDDLIINKVALYWDNWNFIKFTKLDDNLIEILKNNYIEIWTI